MDLRNIVAGLAAAVILAVLAALGGKAPPDKAGWRSIKPSSMHWTGVTLGTGLVLLMAYVRLFVGSSRPDAESQMNILSCLIVAFALGTIAVALSMAAIRRQGLRWRGSRLVFHRGGREHEADLDAVTGLRTNALGQAMLSFGDGTTLRLDPYARGAAQLIEAVEQRLARI